MIMNASTNKHTQVDDAASILPCLDVDIDGDDVIGMFWATY